MSTYVQLKRGNDWGHEYYAITPLNDRGFAEAKRGIRIGELENGDLIRVQWPDGSTGSAELFLRTVRRTVPDMGHSYEISFEQPQLKTSVNGVTVYVDLDDVLVEENWARQMGAK